MYKLDVTNELGYYGSPMGLCVSLPVTVISSPGSDEITASSAYL